MQTATKETKRDQVVAQLFLNFVSLRDLFGVKTKLKDSLLKSNNQINTTFVTRTWISSTEWPERGQVQDGYLNEKMVVVPVCLMLPFMVCACCILLKVVSLHVF